MYEYMFVFAIMYTTIFVWLNFILTDEAHLSFFKMSIKYLFTHRTALHNFAHSGNEISKSKLRYSSSRGPYKYLQYTSLNRSHFCYIFFYSIQLRLY